MAALLAVGLHSSSMKEASNSSKQELETSVIEWNDFMPSTN